MLQNKKISTKKSFKQQNHTVEKKNSRLTPIAKKS